MLALLKQSELDLEPAHEDKNLQLPCRVFLFVGKSVIGKSVFKITKKSKYLGSIGI